MDRRLEPPRDGGQVVTIGQWVQRNTKGAKWHLVESVVAGDAVTKCGRRMDSRTRSEGIGLEVSDVQPLTRMIDQPQLCRACS
jgi:hypothetical protein